MNIFIFAFILLTVQVVIIFLTQWPIVIVYHYPLLLFKLMHFISFLVLFFLLNYWEFFLFIPWETQIHIQRYWTVITTHHIAQYLWIFYNSHKPFTNQEIIQSSSYILSSAVFVITSPPCVFDLWGMQLSKGIDPTLPQKGFEGLFFFGSASWLFVHPSSKLWFFRKIDIKLVLKGNIEIPWNNNSLALLFCLYSDRIAVLSENRPILHFLWKPFELFITSCWNIDYYKVEINIL